MAKLLTGGALVFVNTILVGCIHIPEARPINAVTYKLDKDKKQWTQTDCVTKHDMELHRVESVCREQIISSPPAGIEKRLGE